MNELSLQALGTHWHILVSEHVPQELYTLIAQEIASFESQYSRFLPNSYIGRLNSGETIVNPPQELVDMLRYALDSYHTTQGMFNISIGGVLESHGYGPGSGARISKNLDNDIELTDTHIRLYGIHIDLGGYGKGWLIDKIALLLRHHHVTDYIINGGGDILVGDSAQQIYLQHPYEQGRIFGEVTLRRKALANSSNQLRQWRHRGINRVHTPYADPDTVSIHVLAKTATEADMHATVLFSMKHRERVAYAKKYKLSFASVSTGMKLYQSPDFNLLPSS